MYVWDSRRINQDTLKKSGWKIFFHLREKWFSKFQNFQKSKFWEKNLKNWNLGKIENFRIILKFSIFGNFDFFRLFSQNFDFWKFWNFENPFSPRKTYFSSGFFLIVLVYSSAILNMYLEHPWYLQNDVIQRKHIVFF